MAIKLNTERYGRAHRQREMSEMRIFFGLDLENLVAPARRAGYVQEAIDEVADAARRLGASGTLLGGVAVCDRDLQTRSAWALDDLGIRVHRPQNWGPNASDLVLLDHLRGAVPSSATTVVIGSGDHIFAPVASALLAQGKRVVVLARPGSISRELYGTSSALVPLTPTERIWVAA